jgi:hypothetical protein
MHFRRMVWLAFPAIQSKTLNHPLHRVPYLRRVFAAKVGIVRSTTALLTPPKALLTAH